VAYIDKRMSELKSNCIACGRSGKKMNKEHLFPKWLIHKTKTYKTKIRWHEGKKIPGLVATLPICEECNTLFGAELESPVAQIFDCLENEKGISDFEAELLIRWLWKMEGMFWIVNHPNGVYSEKYSLKERVLNPIDEVRSKLVLAISIIQTIDFGFEDLPMGIDSVTEIDGIFVSGVFSQIAIMVTLDCFNDLIPNNFSTYNLEENMDEKNTSKIFFPKKGFIDCTEAVGITKIFSAKLSLAHDKQAMEHFDNLENNLE